MKILTSKKRLKEIGEIAYKIRHILYGKNIPKQDLLDDIEEGIHSDSVVGNVEDALKKNTLYSSSGCFRFEKTKKGDVRMIPSFSFLIRIKG